MGGSYDQTSNPDCQDRHSVGLCAVPYCWRVQKGAAAEEEEGGGEEEICGVAKELLNITGNV